MTVEYNDWDAANNPNPEQSDVKQESTKKEGGSMASKLVAFVVAEADLFHDKNSDGYAKVKKTGEIKRLTGGIFKNWLNSNFYKSTNNVPSSTVMKEAISTLLGLAVEDGECEDIFIRIGEKDKVYYLDLAEPKNSRAIEMKPGSWKIIPNPPINFLRPRGMLALDEPIPGGNFSDLWGFLNIAEGAELLVLAWLLHCLRAAPPFAVLEFVAEQGCAKTTTQEFLRDLFDPVELKSSGEPKSLDDLFVNAKNNRVVSLENISNLRQELQDGLCRITSGTGLTKRKHHTNDEDFTIKAPRPVILNGITVSITSQDLVDRTISVPIPRIKDRKEEAQLKERYRAKKAYIFGGLLDIFVKALEILPDINLPAEKRPRLIGFIYLGMAGAKVIGRSQREFLQQFEEARSESIMRTIESSPIIVVFREWFSALGQYGNKESTTTLPTKELWQAVLAFNEKQKRPMVTAAWPKSPRGFGDALRRAAPALRYLGIDCACLGKRGGNILWEVKKIKTKEEEDEEENA